VELVPVPSEAEQAEAKRRIDEETLRQEAARKAEFERTGGSVHPTSVFGFTTSPGLTIRDYFAAKTLHSLMGAVEYIWDLDGDQDVQARFAHLAYQLADAMLDARKPVQG
jgi:hypothetical protein